MNKGYRIHKYLFILTICILVISLLLPGCRKPTIDELIEDLCDPNPDKHHTIETLTEIGTPAVEPLLTILASEDARAREYAAITLGEIGDPRAVGPLIDIIYGIYGRGDSFTHYYINALANIGTPSAEALIADLKDEDESIRNYAEKALGQMGLSAVEALIVLLVDKDSHVQYTAEQLILDIGTPAVEPLITDLGNKPFLIQARVVEILKIVMTGGGTTEADIEWWIAMGFREAIEDILSPFWLLGEGHGVEEMAAYGGPGPHPIVVMDSAGGIHQSVYELPSEWVCDSINDIELVAYVGENEWVTIETCSYGSLYSYSQFGMWIAYREQCQVEVRLIEAQTGSVVADKVFLGPLPRAFRETESFASDEYSKTIRGDIVSFAEIQQWLTTYVEG